MGIIGILGVSVPGSIRYVGWLDGWVVGWLMLELGSWQRAQTSILLVNVKSYPSVIGILAVRITVRITVVRTE